MAEYFSSLAILLGIIFISPLIFNRIKIPLIIGELILGIIVGKSLLNVIKVDPIILFFSSFGLIYLMFLAGLEIDFDEVMKEYEKVVPIAIFGFLIPFSFGFLIAGYAGLNPVFLGAIISTTSVGIVLPTIRLHKDREFANTLLGATALIDIMSIVALAISFTSISGELSKSFIFPLILIIFVFLIPLVIRKSGFGRRFIEWCAEKEHLEIEVRLSFALIVIFAFLFSLIGFEAILGAFLVGLIITELTARGSIIEKKLMSFGYGFFIPLFFVIVGASVDIPLLLGNLANIWILLLILLAGVAGKLLIIPILKIYKFDNRSSVTMAVFLAARLSLVLAAAEVGRSMGYLNDSYYSLFVIFALITSIIMPAIGKQLLKE